MLPTCKFGTFHHVNSVVLELYIKFGSNICDSRWDQHTNAPDIHLMMSRKLTSGFDFWSAGHLRMAVVHLPMNIGVDICIQFRVIDISLKFKMAAPPSWIFSLYKFLHTSKHINVVGFMLCAKFGSNNCYSHWDRRKYASDIHLMTSREFTSGFNFWSRGHLRVAVVHLPI